MDFSLYIIISPNVCRVALAASELPQGPNGGSMFNTQKIKEVIEAGATAIQLREDSYMETSEFARIARAIHEITTEHNIPLVIHDRVDIAVSAGAEGVELGKGCLDYNTARRLMGDQKFVGVAVTTQRQAELASRANASYVVIGPVYKPLSGEFYLPTAPPLGTAGVREILDYCSNFQTTVPHLVSGGITVENIQRVMFQSKAPHKSVDGVVLHYPANEVHEKMLDDIRQIKSLMRARPRFLPGTRSPDSDEAPAFSLTNLSLKEEALSVKELLPMVPSIVTRVARQEPVFGCLVPTGTKDLVGRMSAAIGSIPNFSYDFEEMSMPGRSTVPESCLITMDEITSAACSTYIAGLKAYNSCGYPVIFEPSGATGLDSRRSEAATQLMASGYVTLIKGSYMEIIHLAGMEKEEKYGEIIKTINNVDFKLVMAKQCRKLALRERCVVLATGPVYVLSDGERTVTIGNGSLFLAKAGSQALGSVLAAFLAVELEDPFLAALSGLLLFTITSDKAAEDGFAVHGPGTFLPAFIDKIWKVSQTSADKNIGGEWPKRALVEQIKISVDGNLY